MSRLLIFVFIFMTLGSYSQGQKNISGIVRYRVSYAKEYIEVAKKSSKESADRVNASIKNSRDLYGILNFNSKEASYKLEKQLKMDGEDLNLTYYFAGRDELFYYHKDSLNLVETNSSLGKSYQIIRKPQNWVITKESKYIDELFCIKAYYTSSTDKNKIEGTAWFCPEIPVNYGPTKFYGLPGLIIELHFSKITFIVETIDLSQKNILIEKPTNAPKITSEEFFEIAKRSSSRFFEN